MIPAPERLETARLVLRRPRQNDAAAIFSYASDEAVTRYVAWPRHASVADSYAFVSYSDAQWDQWPAGPYMIELKQGPLIGGAGFGFDDPVTAVTGYVLARDAWNQGFATEALTAVTALAPALGIRRLYAIVHVDHRPSAHVLEKCGYAREALRAKSVVFPNLGPTPADVWCYTRAF